MIAQEDPRQATREFYFRTFDKALAIGHGVQCFTERLFTTNAEIQSTLDRLAEFPISGPEILSEWHAYRDGLLDDGTCSHLLDSGADVFDSVVRDLFAGKSDRLFNCGEALPKFEIGPGLMTVIGAPPGRGKTALAMQTLYDVVTNEHGLKAVVASLEVTAATLIKRRLAMLLDVGFDAIRFNTLTEKQRRDLTKKSGFRDVLQNVGFVKSDRCGLGDLEELLTLRQKPGLLLMDYVQLFGAGDANAQDRGMQTMTTARRFCEAGWAVIAVSAVNRTSYAKGDLGSFRDTSSIEYSGTSAYMLDEVGEYADDESKPSVRPMKLRALKNRNGGLRSIDLVFDGPKMTFRSPATINQFSGEFDSWNAASESANPFEESVF
ncbi:AAA family ATPase [Stieleria sp. TO1_6]|uniref:DnaB-like helicase C-terminal domain-containing protein n=1 Tax=Stieleria tagensis TaxID=2956795 RepID=UPI00209A8C39|nr:DnaB-like helicase C-terminal domain-containing protein [Stieleria tagensis]MCO8121458.1 AAA family ATPase [Stieleria tagensis]